jgi:hypothetical protein
MCLSTVITILKPVDNIPQFVYKVFRTIKSKYTKKVVGSLLLFYLFTRSIPQYL